MSPLLQRAGALCCAYVALISAENLAIGFGYRQMFVGAWEMGYARLYASPIVLGALVPLALALSGWSLLWQRRPAWAERGMAALVGLAAGIALALAPTGRRFANPALRGGLGLLAALLLGGALWLLLRRSRPWVARRPRQVAGVGVVLAGLLWALDAFAYARQYPTLHALLALACLLAFSLSVLGVARSPRALSLGALGFAVFCVGWSWPAARALHRADNLRLVLLEHAPLMGRGVALGARLAPVPVGTPDEAEAPPTQAGRTLEWNDRSLLVITIDALRADHVSTYGYGRKTTPIIDAIAEQSALFEYAYCPTPHTSYSISSLMTGKYMHPLRAMGLGEDSETWADLFRHYGYRTAAFYPPAVFFVDEDRFDRFRETHLGFEYAKVEFATPDLRVDQVRDYLAHAPSNMPLFLWVHLFDPHEPYVYHPEHPFGTGLNPTAMDAYDSEIAVADQTVGRIVEMFEAARPEHLLVISADHGEEFGEHGGRYHGSSVYEEQVRVPLLVRGKGVAPGRIKTPVQTIDLLPTFLSASGTPRPPRLRGRDLGPMLVADKATLPVDEGFAFAEVVPLAMVARGTERLVCRRAENACALYDVATDPAEKHDLGASRPDRVRQMRGMWQRTELDHGRLEGERGASLPPALRRGLQGDRDAALDVAALLDDVDVHVRRTAARVLAALKAEETLLQLERVLSATERDAEVRGLAAVALTRIQRKIHPDLAAFASSSPVLASRRLAAIALAERGDDSRLDVLLDALAVDGKHEASPNDDEGGGEDLDESETIEIIEALRALHAAGAGDTPAMSRALARRLDDVRLRPHLAAALGAFGEVSARAPLLEVFREERNLSARLPEAEALLALRATGDREFERSLLRFAGMPEPLFDAIELGRKAKLLVRSGIDLSAARPSWSGSASIPATSEGLRVFVETAGEGSPSATVGDAAASGWRVLQPSEAAVLGVDAGQASKRQWYADVAANPGSARVRIEAAEGVRAVWLVPLEPELPPPAPVPFDAGTETNGKP